MVELAHSAGPVCCGCAAAAPSSFSSLISLLAREHSSHAVHNHLRVSEGVYVCTCVTVRVCFE